MTFKINSKSESYNMHLYSNHYGHVHTYCILSAQASLDILSKKIAGIRKGDEELATDMDNLNGELKSLKAGEKLLHGGRLSKYVTCQCTNKFSTHLFTLWIFSVEASFIELSKRIDGIKRENDILAKSQQWLTRELEESRAEVASGETSLHKRMTR